MELGSEVEVGLSTVELGIDEASLLVSDATLVEIVVVPTTLVTVVLAS